MASNSFRINLPTIPGKPIRLRVQDIANKGFLSRENRFHSDKTKLTQQFCQTFDNLHRPETPTTPETIEKQQYSTQSTHSTHHPEETPFRYVVPEYKNNLLDIMHRQQRKQLKQQQRSKLREARSSSQHLEPSALFISMEEKVAMLRQKQQNKRIYMENYYFQERERERQEMERIKQQHIKASSMFLTESRDKVYKRQMDNDESLGPGYYPMEPDKVQKKPYIRPKKAANKLDDETVKLKKHTKQIFDKHNIEMEQRANDEDHIIPPKKQPLDHMFVLDDRDRFGDQIFPIVLKTQVPGPGTYDVIETIQDKAKKIVILEEQRKLLKDWFNQ